jgi:hypothetical protein
MDRYRVLIVDRHILPIVEKEPNWYDEPEWLAALKRAMAAKIAEQMHERIQMQIKGLVNGTLCPKCDGAGGRFVAGTDIEGDYCHDWEDCDCVYVQPSFQTKAQPKQTETRRYYASYGSGSGRSKPPFYGVVGD